MVLVSRASLYVPKLGYVVLLELDCAISLELDSASLELGGTASEELEQASALDTAPVSAL